MRSADARWELSRKLLNIHRHPQSSKAEDAIVTLEIEIDILDAEREVKVLRLQKLFYDAYKRTGSMTAIHPSGQTRTERPEYGGNSIQHVWNARNKARSLAEWATP